MVVVVEGDTFDVVELVDELLVEATPSPAERDLVEARGSWFVALSGALLDCLACPSAALEFLGGMATS